jgi:hypothetical protein
VHTVLGWYLSSTQLHVGGINLRVHGRPLLMGIAPCQVCVCACGQVACGGRGQVCYRGCRGSGSAPVRTQGRRCWEGG